MIIPQQQVHGTIFIAAYFFKTRRIKTWQNVQCVFIKHRLNFDRYSFWKKKTATGAFYLQSSSPCISFFCLSVNFSPLKKKIKTSKKKGGEFSTATHYSEFFLSKYRNTASHAQEPKPSEQILMKERIFRVSAISAQ